MISSSTILGLPLVASLTGSVEPWMRIFHLYRATNLACDLFMRYIELQECFDEISLEMWKRRRY